MKIKITCPCSATFEVNENCRNHPRRGYCPNCGRELPPEAKAYLIDLIESFKGLNSILDNSEEPYKIKILHHPKS